MFRIEQWGPCCDVYLLWFVRIPSLKEIPLVEKIHHAYPNGKYPHHQLAVAGVYVYMIQSKFEERILHVNIFNQIVRYLPYSLAFSYSKLLFKWEHFLSYL